MRRAKWLSPLPCLSLLLSACATQPGTILERFSLAGGQSITTDSRQRVVMANALRGASRPGLVNPEQIVCAEPSPDVAIALRTSRIRPSDERIANHGSSYLTKNKQCSSAPTANPRSGGLPSAGRVRRPPLHRRETGR